MWYSSVAMISLFSFSFDWVCFQGFCPLRLIPTMPLPLSSMELLIYLHIYIYIVCLSFIPFLFWGILSGCCPLRLIRNAPLLLSCTELLKNMYIYILAFVVFCVMVFFCLHSAHFVWYRMCFSRWARHDYWDMYINITGFIFSFFFWFFFCLHPPASFDTECTSPAELYRVAEKYVYIYCCVFCFCFWGLSGQDAARFVW